ncbi:hypothetical protein CPB97_002191 [Podila verticillata]|nr:hypothetical protein CPB97_002191 [Podila verticillata]
MKSTFIIAVLAATATVNAYQCPDTTAVNQACRSISVRPLACNDPKVNVQECNAKQCIQTYIDNYSACQCARSSDNFYEHSANVQGLLKRCGLADLKNPYGNPYQYRPGQGTQIFAPSSSNISGIISGTSARGAVSAAPIVSPTQVSDPDTTENNHISGGAVAGIVLGTVAAAILAGLLGWCWRKERKEHTAIYSHSAYESRGPTRTVVTEKIEPVVVKSNSNNATTPTSYGTAPAMPATDSTAYTTSGQSAPMAHSSTTYNTTAPVNTYPTTTTDGYNTQPRAWGVGSGVTKAAKDTTNAVGDNMGAMDTGASNAAYGTSNAKSDAAHGTATAVGSGANTAGNTFR